MNPDPYACAMCRGLAYLGSHGNICPACLGTGNNLRLQDMAQATSQVAQSSVPAMMVPRTDGPSRGSEEPTMEYEVFYRTADENLADSWVDENGDVMPSGWYWWYCLPGCLPDSDACGPFDTEAEATADVEREEEMYAPAEDGDDDDDE